MDILNLDINNIWNIVKIGLVQTGVIGIFILLSKNGIATYINKRFEINAVKKDIEELTSKVEIVKSSIGLLSSYKKSHRDEERACLIEFYTGLTNLMLVENPKLATSYRIMTRDEILLKSLNESFIMQTRLTKIKLIVLNKDVFDSAAALFDYAEKINQVSINFGLKSSELEEIGSKTTIPEEKIIFQKALEENRLNSLENLKILNAGYPAVETKFIDAVQRYLLSD